MGSFSIWHWLIVLLIVVLIFGTKKLKNIGSDLGGAVKGFKDGVRDGTATPGRPGSADRSRSAPTRALDPNTVDVEAKTQVQLIARSERVRARMIDFGFDKLALIGAVALIVIGPEKLPRVARTVGTLLGKAQRYVADVKAEVNRSIELEELKKMKTEFEDAARNVEQTVSSEVQPDDRRARQRLAAASRHACRRSAATARSPTPPPPTYRHPKKNWRLKRGAMPQWYKQKNGIRARRSRAPRVARFRPPRLHDRRALRAAVRAGRGRPWSGPALGRSAMADKDPDELAGTEQPFVSHLVELRDRLIRAAIAVGVCFARARRSGPGPARSTTCSRRRWSRTCRRAATLIATNVISPFLVPLKITLMAAFLLALAGRALPGRGPSSRPGLYTHEKKLVLPLVVSSTLLFFLGVGFCYFFVFGKVFTFIQSFAPKSITAVPDIEAYLSFVMTMFIAFGAAFEVPIAVVVLARIGIVSIEKLKAFRCYFIVLAFIIAAVLTPPDVVSQLALAIPMCLLYEVGIWAAQIFIKHTQAPAEETTATP